MATDLPLSEPHDAHPRKPKVSLPPGACDTHAHVFGPGNKYPFLSTGLYTPADALPEDYRHMLDVLGVERAVLVQPSVYGTNNDAMLDAIARDPKRMLGVAVLPFDTPTEEIERLHGKGIRGIRCNIVDLKTGQGQFDLSAIRAFAERSRAFGWHVEFLMHVDEQPTLDKLFADFPTPVSFGHLGYVMPPAKGTDLPGFKALLRLMKDGKAWVKLTAPYRLSAQQNPYADVDPFAQALLDAAPERLLWGSDWPHVHPRPGGPRGVPLARAMPNDGDLFDVFSHWIADEKLRRRILVDNPAALYGFK